MTSIRRFMPVPLAAGNFNTGTWTNFQAAGTQGAWVKTANAETTKVQIPFILPSAADGQGGKLISVSLPFTVGTADLTGVIVGTLRKFNPKACLVPIQTFTASPGTNLLTGAIGFLGITQDVVLSTTTTLPSGLATSTTYYVGNIVGKTFQLFTSALLAKSGSQPIVITDAGTGTHTVTANGYSLVSPVAITEAGTQVTQANGPTRLYTATVTIPAFDSPDLYGTPISWDLNIAIPCAVGTILAVINQPVVIYDTVQG